MSTDFKRTWFLPGPVDNSATFYLTDNHGIVMEYVCPGESSAEWKTAVPIPSSASEIKKIRIYFKVTDQGGISSLNTTFQKISFFDDTTSPTTSLISHNVSGLSTDNPNYWETAIITPSSTLSVNQLKADSDPGEGIFLGFTSTCSTNATFRMNIAGIEVEWE